MLYHHLQAKSSCGFGLIAQMDDQANHQVIEKAISALTRLTHRGAVAADGLTGDGCGILMKMPHEFMHRVTHDLDIHLAENYAVGMFFIPDDDDKSHCMSVIERRIRQNGLTVAGWREVPVNPEHLGEQAKQSLPLIKQIFVNAMPQMSVHDFDRALFIARHQMRDELKDHNGFYNCSLSTQTIVYKGLMMPKNLPEFYLDLGDTQMKSSLAIFHQRFSTNTAPQWRLAQPFRLLAHNGEINTINANRSWALARIAKTIGERFPELMGMRTLVNQIGSDSSSLDNMLELLLSGGIDLKRAMRLLVPPAWQNVEHLHPDLRAFYEYNSMHMEPWDGPAGIVLTDGRYAGCSLDRNGLRPARYVITKNRELLIASENGTCDIAENDIVEKGRLRAGELMLLDLQTGKLLKPDAIDEELMNRAPYSRWLSQSRKHLRSVFQQDVPVVENMTSDDIRRYEQVFELSFEERNQVIRSMIEDGQESIGSMGDDTPVAVLSQKTRPFYDYFRQLFAQVTNPPIDPLRESMVMSLQTCLGAEHSMFREGEAQAARIVIDSPILCEGEFQALLDLDNEYPATTLDLNYDADDNLENALTALCDKAYHAIQQGSVLLILDDSEISAERLPIHALLATGTLHEYLITKDLRGFANIVVKTATARDPHHMACLLGAGATLIYPYFAYEVIGQMLRFKQFPSVTPNQALNNYRKAIDKGLYKIMSKMGISTITSYRGSQLFEVIGLSTTIRDHAFSKMACRIGGVDLSDLDAEQRLRQQRAFVDKASTPVGGILKYMRGGEYHAYNPDVVQLLQAAVVTGDYNDYGKYRDAVNHRTPATLRDLLSFTNCQAIAIDDVEPMSDILRRFDSAAMSLGALSPEAHETLAAAMNELGGRSNSGEGGEDEKRFGTNRVSKIKQIASGRFGVTPHYLVNAEVLQIKVAQGAKPGEGGQLPGHKTNAMIAELRYCKPGVTLISPPPHHDIYSIEDLAQLIHDLKQVNPDALVSVKLVSAPGVGTIATGVAKCYADMVTISGYDGGTGASPQTSIRYAGSPWELGLAETHQALLANDLRDKIIVQTDGGLKTGLDVVKAAILGAETFGFGTGPMIAMGCKYLRICHLNNCATGVATQNDILREKHYHGNKERVKNYFRFIAQEVREILAQLGEKSLENIIGKTELLQQIEAPSRKQAQIDLSAALASSTVKRSRTTFTKLANTSFDSGELNQQLVSELKESILNAQSATLKVNIKNTDRSAGATLSGLVAKHHGKTGLAPHTIHVRFVGTAGQSFGVWNAGGVDLTLWGEANDYAGKGMSGGQIVVRPHRAATFDTHHAPIVGNTCLYGATGGTFYAAGCAGERFAVRNSGATAVIEGTGDHCCEYMTGGTVIVLGQSGMNFGAGMTGGMAFVLDNDNSFFDKYNKSSVDVSRISLGDMTQYRDYLREHVIRFAETTGSTFANEIINDFERYAARFWLVKPKSEELSSLMSQFTRAA